MLVVIAHSKMNPGQLIYLIKAKAKRWRPVGKLGQQGPQEFFTVERAQAEIRRATQSLECKVIAKAVFDKLWKTVRAEAEQDKSRSHVERLLDLKLGRMARPVEMADDAEETDDFLTDAEFGASDGGYTSYEK